VVTSYDLVGAFDSEGVRVFFIWLGFRHDWRVSLKLFLRKLMVRSWKWKRIWVWAEEEWWNFSDPKKFLGTRKNKGTLRFYWLMWEKEKGHK